MKFHDFKVKLGHLINHGASMNMYRFRIVVNQRNEFYFINEFEEYPQRLLNDPEKGTSYFCDMIPRLQIVFHYHLLQEAVNKSQITLLHVAPFCCTMILSTYKISRNDTSRFLAQYQRDAALVLGMFPPHRTNRIIQPNST